MLNNGKYNCYYDKIIENKIIFERKLTLLDNSILSESQKIGIALNLLFFATYSYSGYFYSIKLENFFIDIANKYDINNYHNNYKKNSFLHVMTEAYNSGGHTRVVERFIQNIEGEHSVYINNIKSIIPDFLQKIVNQKNGKILFSPSQSDIINNALFLRNIAQNYEYIILHTHMEDPTATIAFGTEKFKRPVILYNHADHLFWIGKRISDVVLDFRTTDSISKKYRFINNSKLCPIPITKQSCNFNKIKSRKILNINENDKVLMTIGSRYKYIPIENDGIFDSIEQILSNDKDIKLYAIGIEQNDYLWKYLSCKFKNRIKLLGIIKHGKKYLEYLSAADLIIDSYPIGGGTVLVDAMNTQTPFVSLKTEIGQTNFVVNSKGYVKTKNEFVDLILKCLNDEKIRIEILLNELELFYKDHDINNWIRNTENILKNIPKKHIVKDLTNEKEPVIINDYTAVLYKLYSSKNIIFDKNGRLIYRRVGLKYLCEIVCYKDGYNIYYYIKVFGFITIFKINKIYYDIFKKYWIIVKDRIRFILK